VAGQRAFPKRGEMFGFVLENQRFGLENRKFLLLTDICQQARGLPACPYLSEVKCMVLYWKIIHLQWKIIHFYC
jgi:hypothetical protein